METISLNKFRFRKKIASFDYDWTLVKPKSNHTIPKNIEDWMWLRQNVPDVLRSYYDKGYSIIIFTNQSKPWKIDQIKEVLGLLNIPVLIVIATSKEYYKPNTHIFNENIRKLWDKKYSFYCGDALGRVADWSDSDKQFANNIGIQIKQPEEMFPFVKEIHNEIKDTFNKDTLEMVILIGFPGSGKTTFAKKHFNDTYKIVSGDDLKTMKKITNYTRKMLEEKHSVIIDSTNASKKKRAEFIEIAKTFNIPVRCIYITTSLEESIYRNNERAKDGNGVPKIVYNVYKKHFEEPTQDEGCEVIKV